MPRQRPPRANEKVVSVEGRLFLFRDDQMAFEIPKGKPFLGSKVHESGRWATCPACGNRHAVGVRCVCNGKGKREHRDQRKPDDIKGT